MPSEGICAQPPTTTTHTTTVTASVQDFGGCHHARHSWPPTMDQQQKLQDHHYAIRSWYVCLGNTRDRWSANECVKTSEVASTHAQLGRTTMKRPALEKFGELQKQLAELDEYHFKAPLACQLAPSLSLALRPTWPLTDSIHWQPPIRTLSGRTWRRFRSIWRNWMIFLSKHR